MALERTGFSTGWREEWPIWLLSLIIAIGLYVFVSSNQPQTTENRVIGVIVRQSGKVAVASSIPLETNLKVTGAAEDIKAFLDRDPVAILDITNATVGQSQELRLRIEPEPALGLVKATLEDERVLVDLEPKAATTKVPKLVRSGQLHEGLSMEKEIEDLPTTVTISGPESRMREVAEVTFAVDLSQFEGTKQVDIAFRPVDAAGVRVPFVGVEPPDAKVRILIQRTSESIDVPVEIITNGFPAPGYMTSGQRVEPQFVKIFGKGKDLAKVIKIQTEPIEIGNIAADQSFTRKLVLPPNIEAVEPPTVTVYMEVEQITTKRTLAAVPVAFSGQREGLTYTLQPSGIQLKIEGTPVRLREVSDELFRPFLAVGQYDVGTYAIDVEDITIQTPSSIAVTDRGPAQLTLQVARADDPADDPDETP